MRRIELMGWDKARALAAPIRMVVFVDEHELSYTATEPALSDTYKDAID